MLGPLRKRLPVWPLVVGCLLPDLTDKPLYYLLPRNALISGSRSFGHTLLFLVVLLAIAAASKKKFFFALAAGVATHLALDIGGELFSGSDPEASIWRAIFWPLFHGQFPVWHFDTVLQHLMLSVQSEYLIAGEIIGGAILLHAAWKRRHSS